MPRWDDRGRAERAIKSRTYNMIENLECDRRHYLNDLYILYDIFGADTNLAHQRKER